MSDLFDYLDCSGNLYGYLGHFRQARYLEQGHNTMGELGDPFHGNPIQKDESTPPPGGSDFRTRDPGAIEPEEPEDRNEINPIRAIYRGKGPAVRGV